MTTSKPAAHNHALVQAGLGRIHQVLSNHLEAAADAAGVLVGERR